MYWTKETLLEHLPFVYRERDAEIAKRDGLPEGPLSAMMGVMARQIGAVEDNVDQMYENWFVETCEPWVLPYIGELLGVTRLPSTTSSVFTPRAYLANTMGYRRRKGTPAMLEQLSRDATGWHAIVVEYFFHLAKTQHLNLHRPNEWLVPDIRNLNEMELLQTPFADTNHLPELRNIDGPFQGQFNIANIGLHLWPLQAFSPPDATGEPTNPPARFAIESRPEPFPAAVGDPVERWYLNPIGTPIPLFNRPQGQNPTSGETTTRSTSERDVPDALRRLALHDELDSLRQSIADADPVNSPAPNLEYFGDNRPILQLFVDDELAPIPPEEIRIVDFSQGWALPDATESYQPANGDPAVDLPIRVAVDPARGQVAFSENNEPVQLRAVFAYGFTMEMGGGPYDRSNEILSTVDNPIEWQIGVSIINAPVPNVIVDSIIDALAAWNAQPAGTRGVICIMDSMRYEEVLIGANRIEVPEGSHLTIVAADWPEVETDPGIFERPLGIYSPSLIRPHLLGQMAIVGTAPEGNEDAGVLHVEGLLIEGNVEILPGHLAQCNFAHCTLPVTAGVQLEITNAVNALNVDLSVEIKKSRFSKINCIADIDTITIEDSIIGLPDDPVAVAIAAADTAVVMDRSTFWGPINCRRIDASESIFMETIVTERTQVGCVRFSYLGDESKVPRPFRCEPSLAIAEAGAENDAALAHQIKLRVRPLYVSMDPDNPTYARLANTQNQEIRRGGVNRREMGAFSSLEEPLREDFLRDTLDEYLRAGLSAGLLYELPPDAISYANA